MSKIKNGRLNQYGAEPFKQQQFGTAGVEWVKGIYRPFTRTCHRVYSVSKPSTVSETASPWDEKELNLCQQCQVVNTTLANMRSEHVLDFYFDKNVNLTSIPWAVRLSWLENAYSCSLCFGGRLWPIKCLVYDESALVGLCTRDYNFLCAGVAILPP